MEAEGRDFLNTPPMKTVRFGGSVVETLDKLRQGDSSDYELLRHQLADPDIKVKYSLLLWELDVCACVCVCVALLSVDLLSSDRTLRSSTGCRSFVAV